MSKLAFDYLKTVSLVGAEKVQPMSGNLGDVGRGTWSL